jgi:hypothetical protein
MQPNEQPEEPSVRPPGDDPGLHASREGANLRPGPGGGGTTMSPITAICSPFLVKLAALATVTLVTSEVISSLFLA